MKKRGAYLLTTFLLTLFIFMMAKVVFMLSYTDSQQFTLTDMMQVLQHGLSLDLSTALYVIAVPFLLTLASIWVPLPRWILKIFFAVIATAMSLAFVADTSLYEFWHFKLDASCLGYLETPKEAMASVSTGYLIVRFVVWLFASLFIYALYARLIARIFPKNASFPAIRASQKKSGATSLPSPLSAIFETVLYILLIPLIVIGIRGGIDESTTNVGQVYYSPSQFLNHSAVNPVFNFLASFEKTSYYIPDYQFMDEDECTALIKELFPTESITTDTLLTVNRPNIVVVLLESCGALFTQLEGKGAIMPNLNRLMNEGISFDSCYANSWRTDRGTVCTYSGYPSFPVSSVMKMPVKTPYLPGLARTLRKEGYQTHYVYGGDINFTNMRSYLIDTGFEGLTWKKDYPHAEQTTAEWGVRDDLTFETVFSMLSTPREKPLFIGYSTLSTHQPWDVPMKVLDDEVENAFYYLDKCIGDFIGRLKTLPTWDSTLVIFLPDHSITYYDMDENDKRRNHIPIVWTGGAVQKARRISTICNQTDLAATLLGQLGIDHSDYRYSRDVLSSNYTYPFAVHTFNNGFSLIDSTGFAVYDLDAERLFVDESSQSNSLVYIGKAILQSAAEDVKTLDMQ